MIKLLLFLLLLIPNLCFAGTYWVDPNGGAANWAACQGSDPGAGNRCTVSQAMTNAAAGDTVNFKGGTYSYTSLYAEVFAPANSGTSGNMIVFKAASGETPDFVCSSSCLTRGWGISIGKSYIQIDGLTFTGFTDNLISASASYVEIKNSTMTHLEMTELCSGGGSYTCYVSHIWIHDNTFVGYSSTVGSCNGSNYNEPGDILRVGYPCGTGTSQGLNHHITIENNTIRYAGHAVYDGYGTEIVFRNNVLYNPPFYTDPACGTSNSWPSGNTYCSGNQTPWTCCTGEGTGTCNYDNAAYNGKYSHRVAQFSEDFLRDRTNILVEGNRFGHAGVNPNNDGSNTLDIAAPKNIIRYNANFASMNNNVMFKYGPNGVCGTGGKGGNYNRFYNNTIYHSGYGYPYYQTSPTQTESQVAIDFYNGNAVGNVIKNNLVYETRRYELSGWDIEDCSENTCSNNWLSSDGDPLFTSTDLSDPTSATLPNFNLQAGSGAINGGTYLTQANGAGSNSTALIVNDALYFQDGTWGSTLAKASSGYGGTFQADQIAIGTVTNVVTISSINYTTNTITLAAPMSWDNNANIWLYKKSDGTQVLYGSAPDYGAYESEPPVRPIKRYEMYLGAP